MASYLVETYLPRLRAAEFGEASVRARLAAKRLSREGTPIRHLRSIFLPEDETCLHFFEAPNSESVREAAQRAELPCDRIVEALEGTPRHTPPSIANDKGKEEQ